MKHLALVLCGSFLFSLAACNKSEPAAAGTNTETPAAANGGQQMGAMNKVREAVGKMMTSLSSLKDPATADKAKAALEQQVAAIKEQLAKIDTDKFGAAWQSMKTSMQKQIDEQIAKFNANPELRQKVEPVLLELKKLFEGA